jgi:hypothetical protein
MTRLDEFSPSLLMKPILRLWVKTPALYKKNYNSTSSLVRFEKNNIFFYNNNSLTYYNAGVVVLNSKVAELGSE